MIIETIYAQFIHLCHHECATKKVARASHDLHIEYATIIVGDTKRICPKMERN